ncbi:hypothetical protein V1477_014038 [Vespula maculifrons]|uniref:Uncharacterized protein n=1 Tax=Vespula maculifrons TaxID=7453 RepID=A0ABD2BLZ4_VESMC
MDTFLNKHDLLGAPTGLCILAGVGRSDERRMDVERLNPYAWTPFQARMPTNLSICKSINYNEDNILLQQESRRHDTSDCSLAINTL